MLNSYGHLKGACVKQKVIKVVGRIATMTNLYFYNYSTLYHLVSLSIRDVNKYTLYYENVTIDRFWLSHIFSYKLKRVIS